MEDKDCRPVVSTAVGVTRSAARRPNDQRLVSSWHRLLSETCRDLLSLGLTPTDVVTPHINTPTRTRLLNRLEFPAPPYTQTYTCTTYLHTQTGTTALRASQAASQAQASLRASLPVRDIAIDHYANTS